MCTMDAAMGHTDIPQYNTAPDLEKAQQMRLLRMLCKVTAHA